jgi:hypothetical protein
VPVTGFRGRARGVQRISGQVEEGKPGPFQQAQKVFHLHEYAKAVDGLIAADINIGHARHDSGTYQVNRGRVNRGYALGLAVECGQEKHLVGHAQSDNSLLPLLQETRKTPGQGADTMKAEIETAVGEIRKSLSLLRRHL